MPGESELNAPAFTPQQRDTAKQLASDLLHLLGEADTASPSSGSSTAPVAPATPSMGSKKNMADVADRVLDLISKSTAQIAGTVQNAAPQVWKVMIRQQFASAAADLIGPVISLIALVIITHIGTSLWPMPVWDPTPAAQGDTNNFGYYFWHIAFRALPIVISIFFVIWLVDSLTVSMKKLVNPPYYATRDLLNMLLGRNIPG